MSEYAEENELRSIFESFGRVTRVFLAKDRESGRAKGFAFISFADRADAARACEKIDGCTCCLAGTNSRSDLRLDVLIWRARWLWASYTSSRIRETGNVAVLTPQMHLLMTLAFHSLPFSISRFEDIVLVSARYQGKPDCMFCHHHRFPHGRTRLKNPNITGPSKVSGPAKTVRVLFHKS